MDNNFKKLLEIQKSMQSISNIYSNPYFKEVIKAREAFPQFVNNGYWTQIATSMKAYQAISQKISPALLQQVKIQYDLLARYNFPSVNTNMRVQNEDMAKDYLTDIVNDVNWEAMEQDGIKVEVPPELVSAVKSESPSIEAQSDLTETGKEESSLKDTLSIICHWITIWRFAADAVNYVSNQTNREKAYALYLYIKEYFANIINQ